LFPLKRGDLETDCSCPDYSNPCKHIAAVYYLLGERFDEDPFVLFQLRGRPKDQILSALRTQRTVAAQPARKKRAPRTQSPQAAPVETLKPLAESLEHFWEAGAGIEGLRFSLAAPEVQAAPVKQLGEPAFWQGRPKLIEQFDAAYAAITRTALRQALGEGREQD